METISISSETEESDCTRDEETDDGQIFFLEKEKPSSTDVPFDRQLQDEFLDDLFDDKSGSENLRMLVHVIDEDQERVELCPDRAEEIMVGVETGKDHDDPHSPIRSPTDVKADNGLHKPSALQQNTSRNPQKRPHTLDPDDEEADVDQLFNKFSKRQESSTGRTHIDTGATTSEEDLKIHSELMDNDPMTVVSPAVHNDVPLHDPGDGLIRVDRETLPTAPIPTHHNKQGGETAGSREDCLLKWCLDEHQFLDSQVVYRDNIQDIEEEDDMDFFGLGRDVKRAVYGNYEIRRLHDWQREMILRHLSTDGGEKNSLVLAPTSGGKTLCAIILLLRTMLLENKDVIFALPYVAIVTEKVREVKALASRLSNFSVMEYAGSKGYWPIPVQKRNHRTMYIATPEKATGIWKFLCREGLRRKEIGMVVCDELQMLGQGQRGSVLEELIVNLLHMSKGAVRLLALSATVGNPDALRVFLGGGNPDRCTVHQVSSRPVAIREHLVVAGRTVPILRGPDTPGGRLDFSTAGRAVLTEDGEDDRRLIEDESLGLDHTERVIAKLVLEAAVDRRRPVLIFCGTRRRAVAMCTMQARVLRTVGRVCDDDSVLLQRKNLRGHLYEESKGMVDRALMEGIDVGVAFHTAGLHPTERKAVEDAYSKGILSALFCTSTLAAGVNLPASRVIIASPWTGGSFITCSSYLQQVGRAGRNCLDRREADAYMLVAPNDVERFETLMKNHVEAVGSQLRSGAAYYTKRSSKTALTPQQQSETPPPAFSGVTRIVLGVLEIGRTQLEEVFDLYRLTLLYQQGVRSQSVDESGGGGGDESREWTMSDLFAELQLLIDGGYVEMLKPRPDEEATVELQVTCSYRQSPSLHPPSTHATDQDGMKADESTTSCPGEPFTAEVRAVAVDLLSRASVPSASQMCFMNCTLRLSPFSLAASSGPLTLDDASRFVEEVEKLQGRMDFSCPLTFLYLSITPEMSKPLVDDEASSSTTAVDVTGLIAREMVRDFEGHRHAAIFEQVGLTEARLNQWIMGRQKIRQDEKFVSTLTRMWSALFIKELCECPERFEMHCKRFGFDRGLALQLSSALGARCNNLKTFCQVLEKFWWYPPLAGQMAGRLTDAARDDLRPLLVLRHVTPERAKAMTKMGLKTLRDVAMVYPPTKLSDTIKYLGKWQAVMIVMDARMLLSHEALSLTSEAQDCREVLMASAAV